MGSKLRLKDPISIVGFDGICCGCDTGIHRGGSSAFSRDRLEIRLDVAILCSTLSNDRGLAGNVILEGQEVTSNEFGIIDEKIFVDCGADPTPFKFVVTGVIEEQVDTAVIDVVDPVDIVLEEIALTLGNSFKLISTRSSYKL